LFEKSTEAKVEIGRKALFVFRAKEHHPAQRG